MAKVNYIYLASFDLIVNFKFEKGKEFGMVKHDENNQEWYLVAYDVCCLDIKDGKFNFTNENLKARMDYYIKEGLELVKNCESSPKSDCENTYKTHFEPNIQKYTALFNNDIKEKIEKAKKTCLRLRKFCFKVSSYTADEIKLNCQ